ncbi:hypothetical protein B0H10DRAFT_1942857 [Mycena sp. CBHHK59/15]|nr:hypothetical protein B0H10DRAFT_1942857 [Mycena sp. CBHHK59/15]
MSRRISASEAIQFVRARRRRSRPNYNFIRQLQVFSECEYNPCPTIPQYIAWKEKQEFDNTNVLRVIDGMPIIPEGVYLGFDFPSDPNSTRALLHHLVPSKTQEMLLVSLPSICQFISQAMQSDNGGKSRVLIHCMDEARCGIAICAYLMFSRSIASNQALAILQEHLPLFNDDFAVRDHLRLFGECNYVPTGDHPLIGTSSYMDEIVQKGKLLQENTRQFFRCIIPAKEFYVVTGDVPIVGKRVFLSVLNADGREKQGIRPLDEFSRCGSCGKKQSELGPGVILKHCKACSVAVYCKKECQRADWSSHKHVCKLLSQMSVPRSHQPTLHPDDSMGLVRYGEKGLKRTYPPLHYSTSCAKCGNKQRHLPSGETLKHCNACGMVYCGDVCQREDWPYHKELCKLNRRCKMVSEKSEYPKILPDLEKFCRTFQSEIVDAAGYALKIHFNRFAGYTTAFEICLLYIPDADKAHSRFKLQSWNCVSFAKLEPQILTIVLPKLKDADPEHVHFFVILRAAARGQRYGALCKTMEYNVDPDLGPWNANWEDDFITGITIVQQGAPKLR